MIYLNTGITFSHFFVLLNCLQYIYNKTTKLQNDTECVTDLDWRSKMIIFQLVLTTFEASIIFSGRWGSSGNWLKPKTKPPLWILTKFSFCKSLLHTVWFWIFRWILKNVSPCELSKAHFHTEKKWSRPLEKLLWQYPYKSIL